MLYSGGPWTEPHIRMTHANSQWPGRGMVQDQENFEENTPALNHSRKACRRGEPDSQGRWTKYPVHSCLWIQSGGLAVLVVGSWMYWILLHPEFSCFVLYSSQHSVHPTGSDAFDFPVRTKNTQALLFSLFLFVLLI